MRNGLKNEQGLITKSRCEIELLILEFSCNQIGINCLFFAYTVGQTEIVSEGLNDAISS